MSATSPSTRRSTAVPRLLLAGALVVNLVTMYAPRLPAQSEPAFDLRPDLLPRYACAPDFHTRLDACRRTPVERLYQTHRPPEHCA